MDESKVIAATKRPYTVDSLCEDMHNLGVTQSDNLIVHSSLSSIGWVCGGTVAVNQALERAVQSGTIVMPSQSRGLTDPAQWVNPPVPSDWLETIYKFMPAFDPTITPASGMGAIAELFRTLPGTMRSNHPQSSFAARGKYARQITSEHVLTPQFGMETPLGKLYELNAKVLLIGVGYGNCTSFHLSEVLSGKIKMEKNGTAMMTQQGREWVSFEDYAYESDNFPPIGQAYEAGGNVTTGYIGNALCKLFDMKPAVDFVTHWIVEHAQ